jgi:hypothetical protein
LNALAGLGFGFTSDAEGACPPSCLLGVCCASLSETPAPLCSSRTPTTAPRWTSLGISAEQIFTVPGSGVDSDRLSRFPNRRSAITAGFVGRLARRQGLSHLVQAHDSSRSAAKTFAF